MGTKVPKWGPTWEQWGWLEQCNVLYLALKAGGVLQHVKQFRVVDLQQHPCDLPSQIGMLALCEAGNMKIIMVEVGVQMKTSSA